MNLKNYIVSGLAGLILGLGGCSSYLSIDDEANKIAKYDQGIRNVLELKKDETCNIFKDKNGKPYWIIIDGKKGIKSIMYIDLDGDGKYDQKNIISIPNKLEEVIPDKDNKENYIPVPKKKFEKKNSQIWV